MTKMDDRLISSTSISTSQLPPRALLSGADAKTAFDPGGLLDGLKKALAERVLNAEMDNHLGGENGAGYAAGDWPGPHRSVPKVA